MEDGRKRKENDREFLEEMTLISMWTELEHHNSGQPAVV